MVMTGNIIDVQTWQLTPFAKARAHAVLADECLVRAV